MPSTWRTNGPPRQCPRSSASLARPGMAAKPRVMYLYDKGAVPAGTIERALETIAPGLRELADVEIIPTEGLTYYKLKNFGIGRAKTDLAIMLDSDAAPQPGW